MQTFLPYASFSESARVLDRQRLGKQRVETLQIAKALVTGKGWVNHPATKMWAGYLPALVGYQRAICFEWTNNRGYRDTCLDKTIEIAGTIGGDGVFRPGYEGSPPWLGDVALHLSHRSNLLRKDEAHYRQFFGDDPADLPYVWPAA